MFTPLEKISDEVGEKNFLTGFISVIVPVYNEEENLVELYERLERALKNYNWEIVFVNDGSRDNSQKVLEEIHKKDRKVKIVKLRKNSGQIPAILAGIKIAKGDVIITLDADLQNPPEEIPKFIEKISEGYDAVFGYRRKRKDYFLRKLGSFIFWKFISLKMGRIIKDPGCGFNAIKKELVDKIIKKYGENLKNIKHVIAGESKLLTQLAVSHFPRKKGETKYSFLKLILYASSFLKETFSKKVNSGVLPYEIEKILE
ncbi:MAG: glycosyltransferase family 2 protein [Candidatus Omnitrophota bacterium]